MSAVIFALFVLIMLPISLIGATYVGIYMVIQAKQRYYDFADSYDLTIIDKLLYFVLATAVCTVAICAVFYAVTKFWMFLLV